MLEFKGIAIWNILQDFYRSMLSVSTCVDQSFETSSEILYLPHHSTYVTYSLVTIFTISKVVVEMVGFTFPGLIKIGF